MKRIYSFMVAAVAMFAAAACTQELENVEPEVNGESVVFTAYADGADETKTALSDNKSLWQSGDRIWILNGNANDTGWKKGYSTTDNSATATFTEENDSNLEGEQYFAVYPAAAADNATWEGGDVLGVTLNPNQNATPGSYDPAAHIAVAKSTTTSLKFKNAVSLLKFTVKNEGVKSVTIYAREGGLLTGSCNISADGDVTPWTGVGEANGWVELSAGEGTFAVGTEYYIAVFPNTDEANLTAGFTVQFSFGGAKYDVKSYTKALTLNRNEILDLGELEYAAAERAETVYLCPGVWSADGAWFAAYFFGTAGEATAVEMTENDGVYSCDVPSDYENVIFCRMNPDFTEFGWDVWDGETEVENHVWDQTGDLVLPLAGDTKVYYNVTDWDAGEWSATPQESTPEEPTEITVYFRPSNDLASSVSFAAWCWGTGEGAWYPMSDSDGDGIYELTVSNSLVNIIFTAMNSTTPDWNNKVYQTGDLKLPADDNCCFLAATDTWVTLAEAKEYVEPTPEPEQVRIYVNKEWGWNFGLWCWDANGKQIIEGTEWPGVKYQGTETVSGTTYVYWNVPETYVNQTVSLLITRINGTSAQEQSADYTNLTLSESVYFDLEWTQELGVHLIKK